MTDDCNRCGSRDESHTGRYSHNSQDARVRERAHGCPRHGFALVDGCSSCADLLADALGLLLEIADTNPWSASYETDWCHYCYADPSYGPKPWRGHAADCLWIRVNQAIGRDVADLEAVDG